MWLNLIFVIVFVLVTIYYYGLFENRGVKKEVRHPAENEEILRRWGTASRTFDDIVWPQRKFFIESIDKIVSDDELNASPQCKVSLNAVAKGLNERKLWAHQFLDATGKGRSGLAYGYSADIGNMDECLAIEAQVDENIVAGQYCMVSLNFPQFNKSLVREDYKKRLIFDVKNSELEGTVYEVFAQYMEMMMFTSTTFRFGICFPSSCDYREIERFLVKSFHGTEISPVISPHCETKDRPMATHHKVALILSLSYIGFVILANLVLLLPEKQSTMLDHFSVITNTEKLAYESTDPLSQRLSFCHGVRFYYQIICISAHFTDIQPFLSAVYPIFYTHNHYWFLKQLYRCTGFFVQIPFAFSGLLSCCMLYPVFMRSRKAKINHLELAFKRWFRTTPALLGVMLLAYAWAGLGSGPLFREGQEVTVEKCNKYWWTNLLYINNWFHHDYHCLFHTWANSADMQCYLVALFVMTVMAKRSQAVGVATAIGIMVSSMAMSSFVTWWKDMPPYPNFDATDSREYELSAWIYFHTYHQLPSYMLGFLVGYCIMENKRMPDKYVKHVWLWLAVTGLPIILIPHHWYTSGEEPVRWLEILYAGIHRLIFVSNFLWLGYLSAFNLGGPFQWFLEIKLLVPFGRMSATVFLAHFSFVWFDVPNSQDYVPYRSYNLVMKFISGLVVSWFYSYLVYLLFEAPSISWARHHLNREKLLDALSVEKRTDADSTAHDDLTGHSNGHPNGQPKSAVKLKGA